MSRTVKPSKKRSTQPADPVAIVRKAVDAWAENIAHYRLALDGSTVYAVDPSPAAEEAFAAMVAAEAADGRGLSEDAYEALFDAIDTNPAGREALSKLEDVVYERMNLALDAGYLLGVEVGRRMAGVRS
jgi:hypothetical protein